MTICQRCGKTIYYAPLGLRWYHCDLNTICPVTHPIALMSYTITSNTRGVRR